MLDAKVYFYNLLKNDAPLVAALGSATKIQYMYPNDFNALPIVTYKEDNAPDEDFFDDLPYSQDSSFQVDVWTNSSTTAIVKLIDTIMKNNLFTREFSADVADPDTKIFHRTMRYRRTLCADDLD